MAYYALALPIKVERRTQGRNAQCDATHIIRRQESVSLQQADTDSNQRASPNSVDWWAIKKERQMKKAALILATVATLAAVATEPAEARGRRGGAALAVAAVATALVVDSIGYGYGPDYHYGSPVHFGGPRHFRGHHRHWRH